MNSKQYTIRAIPDKLDAALRQRAKKTGKSLNEVTIEALARGTGVNKELTKYDSLDWFTGSLDQDDKFDEALQWLDSLPKDMDA